jgi:SAM-dependent methyltransferase
MPTMADKVRRISVREGYDRWAATYDCTPNPLVTLDRRYTPAILGPRAGEAILDAGCGTGAHLARLRRAHSRPVGMDFSRAMLLVARARMPGAALVQASLDDPLPVMPHAFDAVLCALVGEHLANLTLVFREFRNALRPSGRMVFSVFHPEMAAAGIEANFERDGTEYRLGALRYRPDDYCNLIADSGFRRVGYHEFCGDERLVDEVPWATKYLGAPLLLVIVAVRA